VNGCFWDDLDPQFEDLISNYKSKFLKVQTKLLEDGIKMNLSWKIHCIGVRLAPFLKENGCGMACFLEQTTETVDAKLKATLARYACSEDHPNHGKKPS
jgi:hypothetical protein